MKELLTGEQAKEFSLGFQIQRFDERNSRFNGRTKGDYYYVLYFNYAKNFIYFGMLLSL